MRRLLCIFVLLLGIGGCARTPAPVNTAPTPEIKVEEKKGPDGAVESKSSVPTP